MIKMSALARLRLLPALTALLLALAACSVVESIPIGVQSAEEGLACQSDTGAYHLPKTLLRVEVFKETDGSHSVELSRHIVPDPRFGFCLDYLASRSADDTVDIRKNGQILAMVTTDAIDQSRYILQTFIRSIFILASGDPQFPAFQNQYRRYEVAGSPRQKVLFAEYDPFDPDRSAIINTALRDFGYCLVLGPYTVKASLKEIDHYCDHPKDGLRKLGALRPDYQRPIIAEDEGTRAEADRRRFLRLPEVERRGLYYRPRIPYRLELYIKRNPKAEGGWQLRLTRLVPMENIAPLVLVGVDRTLFAKRKTTLMFQAGMLERVCVFKASELLQASYIPLQIVQSVVQVPASILQVRLAATNHETDLVNAQKALIESQIRHLQLLDKGTATQAAGTPVDIKDKFASQTAAQQKAQLYDKVREGVAAEKADDKEWESVCPGYGVSEPGKPKSPYEQATTLPSSAVFKPQ